MKYLDTNEEKTYFQVYAPFAPEFDLRTDAAIVYGLDATTADRVKGWREKGYKTHLMTGLAWGNYGDYLNGKYDGKKHWDEAQTARDGSYVLHSPSVPYMVPTLSFTDYLCSILLPAVDLDVGIFFLEEPEFFAKSGYSEAFKAEWEIYYGTPWQAPHSSVDAQFKASKLKAFLFRRCILTISARLKIYAKTKYDKQIKVYIATHSLINYSQWEIVGPEAALTDRPEIDGFVAQIWTGTSRVPNVYNGVRKERTFATAYLEYGIMQELYGNPEKEMLFLHDPIEDNPLHDWSDYRDNYIKSLIASLFHPKISKFEVCPWPDRVFTKKYPRDKRLGAKAIPKAYKTMLLTVMNALRYMEQSDILWENETAPVGVLMSNTVMFQRVYPDDDSYNFAYADSVEEFSCFYGLCLPLVLRGVPVRPLQIENFTKYYGYLNDYKIIVMSYEYMKPLSPAYHYVLASWVRHGGVLIYVGEDSDSFNNVSEWWHESGCTFGTPAGHLFDVLGISSKIKSMKKRTAALTRLPKYGVFDVGHGSVAVLDENPAKCAQDKAFSQMLFRLVISTAERRDISVRENGYFMLNRGPYTVLAMLGEEFTENLPINGNYIDLLSENLEYETFIVAEPGSYYLLYDIDAKKDDKTDIIALSARARDIVRSKKSFSFTAESPTDMTCACRLYMKKDAELYINGVATKYTRDKNTVFFTFPGGTNKIETEEK